MIKKSAIILGLFFLAVLTYNFVEGITGEVVATGEATSSAASVGVTLLSVPRPAITSPTNATWLKTNLLLNYTVNSPDQINYSINDGANVTITDKTFVDFDNGLNTLRLWVNNSAGLNSTSVVFTVNTSLLTILYTDFNSSARGESTDFYNYTYEEIINLSGIILENINYGKIYFSDGINVSNDSDNTDFEVDLDSNVLLFDNTASINSSALTNFNKSARIYLYNLTYTNPRILVDNAACSSTQCTEINYSGGTLVFNVSHFTKYSADETPSTTTSTTGGGGGGGGSSVSRRLEIIPEGIVKIGLDDQIVVPVKIYNPEKISLRNIEMGASSSTPFLDPEFEDTKISSLGPGENRTLILFISSDVNSVAGEYKIYLEGKVGSPKFTSKATLFIQLVEILGGTEILERIKIAQDLFKDNPICLELNDLLIQAEKFAEEGKVNEATELVQEAIYKCKDLITSKEFPLLPFLKNQPTWRIILEIVLALTIIALIIAFFLRKPKIDLYKMKKKSNFRKRASIDISAGNEISGGEET